MKLTPPSQGVYLVSVVLAVLGLLVFTGSLSIGVAPFWLMTAAFVLLALANLIKGL